MVFFYKMTFLNKFLRNSQLYGIVWNSSAAACWRWQFHTWRFWRFTCSEYVFDV